MPDFALYWPEYPRESGRWGRPITGWNTSREWLVNRMLRGDRLWLFVGGNACGQEAMGHMGFLAEVLVVERTKPHPEHNPAIRGSPRFLIDCDRARCRLVEPPLLIDSTLRRPGKSREQHIGEAREVPFELDHSEVGQLLALLRDKHPDVYRVVA